MNKRKLIRQKAGRGQQGSQIAAREREIRRMLLLAARALESRQPGVADDWCRRILTLEPNNAAALNLRGLVAAQMGNAVAAEGHMRRALAGQPDNPVFNCNLGILLANQGRSEEALHHFEKSLRRQPDNVEILYNLIELYEKTNQLDLATKRTEQALALAPDEAPLRYQLAKLAYRAGNYPHAREIVTGLLGRAPDHDLTQKSLYLLGQACDRLGEHAQAFAAFTQANELLAQTPMAKALEPGRREVLHFIRRQRGSFTRERLQDRQPVVPANRELPPVFLVGFPRSGTTLTGQLLAAHSGILTLDERPTLEPIITDFGTKERLELLPGLSPETIAAHRTRYRQLLRDMAGTEASGRLIVDKNPLYLCYLGMICRFFPEARVIVIHRDPRDVCLSSFMQDFALSPFMQNFLTLEHTVAFYDTVMSLFYHFRDNLDLAMLEVRYEDLVSDFREVTGRIVSFLGLEWEEGIASFHEQAGRRFIRTPSYQQVVQPIYSSAKGRWRNYEAQLAPHLARLQPHIEALGYQGDGDAC